MSKIQRQLTAILRAKKEIVGISALQLKRWELGTSSPSLETFEKVCKDNKIQVHDFFIYDINSLLDFVKESGKKLGRKTVVTFKGE
jgi:transcriptional regulator with XRE-family HTH domain